MSLTPYYQDENITLYHGDSLELSDKWVGADALITDPPYGIRYSILRDKGKGNKNFKRRTGGGSIANDQNLEVRDAALAVWDETNKMDKPVAVFGTWRKPRPPQTRHRLIWHKDSNILGHMPNSFTLKDEEIYVWGKDWKREVPALGSVITTRENRTTLTGRIGHPTPKPLDLMRTVIGRMENDQAVIADPFSGAGSTLIAAWQLGHKAIGVELEEEYCELIAMRLEHWQRYGGEITKKYRLSKTSGDALTETLL